MVDYSRFDRIVVEEEEAPSLPRVTKLDESSKIVIGKEGWQVAPKRTLDYSKWDNIEVESSDEENEYYEDEYYEKKEAELRAAYKPTRETIGTNRPQQEVARDGGTVNGELCWTQSADEVTARFATDLDCARDVRIRVFFDRKLRKCVLELFGKRLILKYDVWCENDDRPHFRLVDRDDHAVELKELDWELERQSPAELKTPRCVRLTLRKRPPARDVVVWWSRLFEPNPHFPETDLDTALLHSRLKRTRNENVRATQDVWESAHRAFLDKVAESDG